MTSTNISDAERRDVARRLRAAKRPSLMVLMYVLGVGGDRVLDRLADLIEPSCDRDALLALADKMRKLGDEEGGVASFSARCAFRSFARRIREALGVSE